MESLGAPTSRPCQLLSEQDSYSEYSFPRAAVTNYCKLGGLKQQKSIFWRPIVHNQGVGRAMLPLKAPGKKPPSSF